MCVALYHLYAVHTVLLIHCNSPSFPELGGVAHHAMAGLLELGPFFHIYQFYFLGILSLTNVFHGSIAQFSFIAIVGTDL